MIDDVGAALNGLPPEVLQRLMGLSTLDEQDAQLQQAMQMAEALRQPQRQHSTGAGALIGGLSGALGNIGAAYLQKKGMDQRGALLKQKGEGRMDFANNLAEQARMQAEALRKRQQDEEAMMGQFGNMSPQRY